MDVRKTAESIPLGRGQTATLSPAEAFTKGAGRAREAMMVPVLTSRADRVVMFTAEEESKTTY